MNAVATTCPYCGVGCGVLVRATGTGIAVSGDPAHPANAGRLHFKGSALGETMGKIGRLLPPVIARAQATWDAALDLMAPRFVATIAEHGPDSVVMYVSGWLLTADYCAANKLMKGYFGSANIDTNSRLCMASSVAGHRRALGSDTVPGLSEDFESADVVVLGGSNLAGCHPVLYQRLAAAKEACPAMRVIVVDPRVTATCDLADLHLALVPGSVAAPFNALLAEIDRRGVADRGFLRRVDGDAAAVTEAHASDPSTKSLLPEALARFCDLWIQSERVVTVYSQGINPSTSGTDKVSAILNCHLATGRIGRPGMGPFSVTWLPNAMRGREVGGWQTCSRVILRGKTRRASRHGHRACPSGRNELRIMQARPCPSDRASHALSQRGRRMTHPSDPSLYPVTSGAIGLVGVGPGAADLLTLRPAPDQGGRHCVL